MNARTIGASPKPFHDDERAALVESARKVIRIETGAIADIESRIDGDFSKACRLILACIGRVVVSGMGKSGHIARKTAATLASTGTPAFFVHPGEASHGDIGMITRQDVVLLLSNSGETEEVLTIVPFLKRQGNALIAMTGNPRSSLARDADAHLDASVSNEACPLGLAPTASTTAALVLGDALAIALLEARGFTADDFARSHPAGALGRRLLKIADVMHTGDAIPMVRTDATLTQALMEMSRKGLGMTAIVEDDAHLVGVFTDGDLRRMLDDHGVDLRTTSVSEAMSHNPKVIGPDKLAAEAAQLMETYKIHALLVVDETRRVVGALNIHDLLRARVV
jgi:arabinose-5-phosphate isomerase